MGYFFGHYGKVMLMVTIYSQPPLSSWGKQSLTKLITALTASELQKWSPRNRCCIKLYSVAFSYVGQNIDLTWYTVGSHPLQKMFNTRATFRHRDLGQFVCSLTVQWQWSGSGLHGFKLHFIFAIHQTCRHEPSLHFCYYLANMYTNLIERCQDPSSDLERLRMQALTSKTGMLTGRLTTKLTSCSHFSLSN